MATCVVTVTPLAVASIAAAVALLTAGAAMACMRRRDSGVMVWATAFGVFALGHAAIAVLPDDIVPTASVVARLGAAVVLLHGSRLFLQRPTSRRFVPGVALAVLAAALAHQAGLGAFWTLGPAAVLTACMFALNAREFLRDRSGPLQPGRMASAVALLGLAAHTLLEAMLFGPGQASVVSVLGGEIVLLALAPSLATLLHQRTHQRLRHAEQRLQHAVEALGQGFALYDANDRLVMANESYRTMFPRLRDLIVPGTTYSELLRVSAETGQTVCAAGREQEWIRDRLEHHLRARDAIEEQLADGRWLYLVERRMPAGERVSLRIDITDIKRREQEVVASESRYRDLIEGSIQGILIDHEWRLIFANRTAAEILGFRTPAELLGRERLDSLLEPYELERMEGYHQARVRGEPAPTHYEADMRRADGRTVRVQWLVRRIRWRGEEVTQSTLVDITERKRAEQALREHQDRLEDLVRARTIELEAANEELQAFSYSVSHDLRAPLRHVRGFAQALAEDYGGALDDTGRDYLERVRSAARRMEDLIDDLLGLSRIASTELRRKRVDLSALAESVIAELRRDERSDRVVEVTIEPGLIARGDPALLRIVLDNLLGNAWKYTVREPVARIALRKEVDDGVVWYVVADNGVGFDMGYSERLFGPFQRLHSEDEFPGDGIGLATVARIVHRHGGRARARGRVGQGASIHFSLPGGCSHKNETHADIADLTA